MLLNIVLSVNWSNGMYCPNFGGSIRLSGNEIMLTLWPQIFGPGSLAKKDSSSRSLKWVSSAWVGKDLRAIKAIGLRKFVPIHIRGAGAYLCTCCDEETKPGNYLGEIHVSLNQCHWNTSEFILYPRPIVIPEQAKLAKWNWPQDNLKGPGAIQDLCNFQEWRSILWSCHHEMSGYQPEKWGGVTYPPMMHLSFLSTTSNLSPSNFPWNGQ